MAAAGTYMTACAGAYFFAILFIVLLAWSINVLTLASKPVNEETCRKYCGSQITQGVLYVVGAILALAATIACAIVASRKTDGQATR